MLKKVTGTTLYEQVTDQIKGMIEEGFYKKGDMLPSEKELMDITGVSRSTVREAIRSLADLGIVETRHGKGSFVLVDPSALAPDTDTAAQQESYRARFLASNKARLVLEPELARLAAQNATAGDIARLEASLDAHKGVERANGLDDFHYIIATMADNPLLLDFMDHLVELEYEGRSAFHLTFPENQKRFGNTVQEHHKKILDAIRRGDGEFAYFYMKEHTQYVLRAYERYFELSNKNING